MSRGMVVDFAVHQPDREDGGIPNPHFHVLCPIRPIEQNGKWGLKQRRVYELDEVMNLSDRILVIYEGEIVGEFDPKKTTVEELGLYMAGAKKQGEAKA